MSISGSLVDASVPEIIQFVYLGRSTGMLDLTRGNEVARLGFHRGDIINAWFQGLPRLGDVLVQRGLLARETVEEIVCSQAEEAHWLNLGEMLVERQLLSIDSLHEILTDLTRKTVFALIGWNSGTFDFTRCVPIGYESIEQIDNSPNLDRLKVRSEGVLLEAAHCLDESRRRADGLVPKEDRSTTSLEEASAGVRPNVDSPGRRIDFELDIGFELIGQALEQAFLGAITEAPADALDLPFPNDGLLVLTEDQGLKTLISEAVAREPVLDRTLRESFGSWAIVDFRLAGNEPGDLAELMPNFPVAGTIGILEGIKRAAEAYSVGVTAATSDDLDDIMACLESLVTEHGKAARRPNRAVSAALERLRTLLRDLQGAGDQPNVALNLLNLVGEVVERAVLLVIAQDRLKAIGAFGFSQDNRPLAVATARLDLALERTGYLERTALSGGIHVSSFEEAQLPESLAGILGRPVFDQVMILPVRGVGEVLGVVYADNGALPSPIEEVDILEIACSQVGVALENELLRRELKEVRAS